MQRRYLRKQLEQLRRMLDRRRLDDLAAIREGIAQADRGEGRPAEDVFAELKRKHGF